MLIAIGDTQPLQVVRPIRINCIKTEQIDHEILDLCTFNESGESIISDFGGHYIRVLRVSNKFVDLGSVTETLNQILRFVNDQEEY